MSPRRTHAVSPIGLTRPSFLPPPTPSLRPHSRYYINEHTGETQWERPEEAAQRKRQHKATEDNNRGMEVRVLHLLKKHRGSRRPASWRCDKITITKDEASRLVSELRDQVVAAGEEGKRAKFEELARVESDCGSAHRGGDLGHFGKGKMMPSFERASFELKPGEMSGLVETDSGVHIILRIE